MLLLIQKHYSLTSTPTVCTVADYSPRPALLQFHFSQNHKKRQYSIINTFRFVPSTNPHKNARSWFGNSNSNEKISHIRLIWP